MGIIFKNFSDIASGLRFQIQRWENVRCLPHCHVNMEIVCVLGGCLSVSVEGSRLNLTENRCALILPYQEHSFCTDDHSETLILVFAPEMVNAFYSPLQNKLFEHMDFGLDDLTRAFILRVFQKEGAYTELAVKGVLYTLCDRFAADNPTTEKSGRPDDLYSAALNYLSRHYTESVTLKEAARELNVHYVYLSKVFSKYAGVSFTKSLNFLRIRKAMNLLNTTHKSMTQIAEDSGFSSVRNFNRQFLANVGKTPLEYRRSDTAMVSGILKEDDRQKIICQKFFT